jgi:hypothetical protein
MFLDRPDPGIGWSSFGERKTGLTTDTAAAQSGVERNLSDELQA